MKFWPLNSNLTFFDFSFTFVEPSDGLFGSFVNGSWNGMIQQILNGVTFSKYYLSSNFLKIEIVIIEQKMFILGG